MLNLGGLFFTLNADTRGLMQAQRRVETFANQVRAAFRGVGRGTVDPTFANSLKRQESAMVSAVEKIKRLQATIASANLTPRGAREAEITLERLGGAFDNFTRKMTSGRLNNLDFGRRVQHMSSQIGDANINIRRLVKEASVGPDPTPWSRLSGVMHNLGSASLVVQGHFGGMSTRLFGFTTLVRESGVALALMASGIAGITAGLGVLAGHALKAGIAMQQLQMQFKAVSGSSAVAGHHLNFVKDVAEQAGLRFQDVGKGYARFLASAQAGGLTLGQTETAFRGVSLAAATMQLSVEDTQGVFRALDQIMSKGTVQAEELRGQLGDRLPGAFIIAANAMGVNTRELNKMLKAGDVVSAEFVPKFVAALQTMYNINPDKPIETFRSSVARLQNQWDYFGNTLANSTNLLNILANTLNGLSNLLKNLSANFSLVAGAAGALAGAIAGLAAAFLLLQARVITLAIISIVAPFIQLAATVRTTAQAVTLLQAAFMGLQAIPILRVITLIAAALLGAYYGFQMLSNAVQMTSGEISQSLRSMNAYISQQTEMGVQIRQVTNDLRNQTVELIRNAQAQAATARAALAGAKAAGPSLMDTVRSLGTLDPRSITNRNKPFSSPGDMQTARIRELEAASKDADKAAADAMKTFFGLQRVGELPEVAANSVGKLNDETKKAGDGARSIDRITNAIKDLQQAASTARDQLAVAFEPLAAGESMQQRIKSIADMGKAMEMTNNLKPKELAAAAQLLGVPNDIHAITGAIATLVQQQRVATETLSEYTQLWDELDKGERSLKNIGTQLAYINAQGGGRIDPNQIKYIENLGAAREQIQALSLLGEEGAKALENLRVRLAQMGFNAVDTATGLAQFNTQLQVSGDRVKTLIEISNGFHKLRDELMQLQGIQGAYGAGGILGSIFNADAGDAFTRAYARAKTVIDQVVVPMIATKSSTADINAESQRWLETLRQIDEQTVTLDNMQAAAERTRDAMRSWVEDGLSGIKDFLTGVKSLKDALTDLGSSMLDSAWQSFVVGPVQDWMSSRGRSAGNAAAAGMDTDVVNQMVAQLTGLGEAAAASGNTMQGQLINSILGVVTGQVTQSTATQVAAASLSALATASAAAAAAITALAVASGGGGEEGGGGGGLVGLITSLVGVFSGPSAAGGSIPSELIPSGLEGIYGGGAAMGGNMQAGKIYNVNEPGVAGEYFIPRVNGYMSNRSGGQGGGNVFNIDASSTIDARGATQDVIADLRQQAGIREERMRKELPFMIDQRIMESSSRGRYS